MADAQISAPPLEYDDSASEVDSAFDDSESVRTQSVTSSVYAYKHEGGRRYHAYDEGQYMIPNDEVEQNRLDLQHHLWCMTVEGKLYLAPIAQDVHNVLDVGTGTGIWAMQFADAHPSANVLGVDLSPIQPSAVPPNCSFRIDNIEADWLPEETYDFIHSRAMLAGMKDWPKFFRQSFEHLKPGGYLELQEFCFPVRCNDPTLTDSSKLVQWSKHCMEGGAKTGLNLSAPHSFDTQLREQGFTDIQVKWFNWPLGPWAKGKKNKEMGTWGLANFLDGVTAANAIFTRVLQWKQDDVEAFIKEVQKELEGQKVPCYQPLMFLHARKSQATEPEVTGGAQQPA